MLRRKIGQSVTEYAVLISLVSMAIFGVSLYIKRGIQGAVKDTADMVGKQRKGGMTIDYRNPNYNFKTGSEINETQNATSNFTELDQGGLTSAKNRNITRDGLLSDVVIYEKD